MKKLERRVKKTVTEAAYMKLTFTILALTAGMALQAQNSSNWFPKDDKERYKEMISFIDKCESFTQFKAQEKATVTSLSKEFYEARWNYIKTLKYDKPTISNPRNEVAEFINFCQKNKLVKGDVISFKRAVTTLGQELITDKVWFKVDSAGINEHRDISYTNQKYSQKLDLFTPKKTKSPVPCILFIHGGGWRTHKRAWFESHAKTLAKEGFAAATIDYRLLEGGAITPLDCVHDVKAAVRWIRANAAKYNIDPDRIGASGGSAGGHLTAILATSGDVSELEGDLGNNNVSSRIQAAVGFATPALTGRKTWPVRRGKLPDWYQKVAPYNYVTKDDAPMAFFHGLKDTLVSPEESKDLHRKYTESGLRTKLELLEDKGHVFYMNKNIVLKAGEFFKTVFEFTP